MAKSRKLEELMAMLNQVRSDPTSEDGLAVLRQVLSSKYSVAIAQAVQVMGEAEISTLIPDLVAAFPRLMVKPQDTDPGCRAKQAIAETLYRFNHSDEALFLSGIRHVQWEPVWGGQVDTAPRLRGTCALGLVRMNYAGVMVELGDLLADPESEARIGAARAIAYYGSDQGVPLLRLRIKVGDTPPVLSECLMALLQLSPVSSLPLAQELLYSRKNDGSEEDVEKAEAVALALGESRLPEAFELLRDWWKQTRDMELRRSGLLAIATLRQTPALDFLVELITEGSLEDAKSATKALSIYHQDKTIWQRVCYAVEQRQEPSLQQVLVKVR